ncbi:MAG: hypothetical protein J6V40_00125, partial [Clostridia bacterium]|nr:hypothetical protein [Clostridia bacterium]
MLALLILEGYHLKLRYLLPNKRYKTLMSESIAKFDGAPEDFIKKYIKSRKDLFRKYGVIEDQNDATWIYRVENGVKKATTLFNTLYDSVKSKGGFLEFNKKIYNHPDFEGSWETYSFTTIDIVSTELKYLLKEVYFLTEYCVEDNYLSDSYTKVLQEKIQKLNKIYSPLLFNLETELKSLCEKLNSIEKTTKKEKK